MKRALGAALAAFLLLGASLAAAQDLARPLMLVATPALKGPYMHTALVVVPMGDKHIGFILNRSTHTRLATAFPEHPPSAKVVEPIYFGGPEAADALFALKHGSPGEPSIKLFEDVYMTGNGKLIDRIIEQTPNEARYFAGFVGWMPDELRAEIARGYWYVGEVDPAEVFRKDAGEAMWEELAKRFGHGKPVPQPGQLETRLPAPPAS